MKDRTARRDSSFGRRGPRLLMAAAMFFSAASELASETVTLSTYYPAPSGVYAQMITTGNTYLARDNASNGGQVGIGTSNPVAGSLLDVEGGAASGVTLNVGNLTVGSAGQPTTVKINGAVAATTLQATKSAAPGDTCSAGQLAEDGSGNIVSCQGSQWSKIVSVQTGSFYFTNPGDPYGETYLGQGTVTSIEGTSYFSGTAVVPACGGSPWNTAVTDNSDSVYFGGNPNAHNPGVNDNGPDPTTTYWCGNGYCAFRLANAIGGGTSCYAVGLSNLPVQNVKQN